jgi:hypothetical protein
MHFYAVLGFHIVFFIGSSYSYNRDFDWTDFGIEDPADFGNGSIAVDMIDFFVDWVWYKSCRLDLSDGIVGNYWLNYWSFYLDRIAA